MKPSENNRLIAEFMDFPDLGTEGDFSYLKYHKSWDWLMPVVREILTLIDINQSDYDASALKFEVLDDDIKRAYIEVIEFIKNYN